MYMHNWWHTIVRIMRKKNLINIYFKTLIKNAKNLNLIMHLDKCFAILFALEKVRNKVTNVVI